MSNIAQAPFDPIVVDLMVPEEQRDSFLSNRVIYRDSNGYLSLVEENQVNTLEIPDDYESWEQDTHQRVTGVLGYYAKLL